jgi:hypothetical protein
MDDPQAHRRQRLIEALEACRPGRDDLSDPELAMLRAEMAASPQLAEAYGRLQRLDAVLAECFADVSVPEGLERRLRQCLAEALAVPAVEAAGAAPLVAESRPARRVSRRVSRRWLLAGAGTLAVAAGLFLAVWIGLTRRGEVYDERTVLEEAIAFFAAEQPGPGQLLIEHPAPEDFPLSRAVARIPNVRWRAIHGFLGQSGVAFDIATAGAEATLYVVDVRVDELPSGPPPYPAHATAGCSTAAWTEDGLVYVLVVRGDSRAYQGLLAHRGPIT